MNKALVLSVFTAAQVLLWASNGWAATVNVSVVDPEIQVGQSTQVLIAIEGLEDGAAVSLGAYDLNLTYDPEILVFTDGVFGDPARGNQLDLTSAGTNPRGLIDAVPGKLEIFEVSLDSELTLDTGQSPSFVLVGLTYFAQREGATSIGIEIVELADAAGEIFFATASGTEVQVVPLPASHILFGCALAVLARIRRLKPAVRARSLPGGSS